MSDVPDATSHVGEVSQDGKWTWDGTAWQPTPEPSQAPLPPAAAAAASPLLPPAAAAPPVYAPVPAPMPVAAVPRRGRGWIGTVAVAVVALIIGAVCGDAVGSNANSTSVASHPNSTPTSTAASPSPATSTLVTKYADVVVAHSATMSNTLGNVGTACSGGNLSVCKTGAQTALADDQAFIHDLGQLTVPACLSAVNVELDGALEIYADGLNDAIKGIDANDATQITTGADLLQLGTTHLTNASSLLNAHPCG